MRGPGVLVLLALLLASPRAVPMSVTGKQVPARAGAPAVSVTSSARSSFIVHCAGCHGMDGSGSLPGRVPDIRQLGRFLRLDGGREFLIKVPGVMASGLSDQDVAEVSNWVLATLAAPSVPAGHQPFDAAEVARARARPLLDVAGERQRLVAQAAARGIALDAAYAPP